MKVTLQKLIGGEAVRTDVVVGECEAYPEIGKQFVMTAPSLTPNGDFRLIQTSPIKSVATLNNSMVIKTENSVYQLEFSK